MIYPEIQRRLSHTSRASLEDNTTFNKWLEKEISDEECFEEFKRNNEIYDNVIKLNRFIDWLKSLGWRRYGR